LSRERGIEVEPRPILFPGLLNAHGNVGPAEIPAKRSWMLKNVLRKSALLDIPMSPPCHHPFNPLMALRASCMDMEREVRWRLIDGFFKAVWLDGQHISDTEVVASIASQAGLDNWWKLGISPKCSKSMRLI
jgi:2-hydroxychromene-2-carboxylate isomerase